MNIHLTTMEQVATLRQGDILKRSRAATEPEHLLATGESKAFDTYKIESINTSRQIMELVMTGSSVKRFASPWQIGRLFIESNNLVAEKDWWL
jgi:hypothetical protein